MTKPTALTPSANRCSPASPDPVGLFVQATRGQNGPYRRRAPRTTIKINPWLERGSDPLADRIPVQTELSLIHSGAGPGDIPAGREPVAKSWAKRAAAAVRSASRPVATQNGPDDLAFGSHRALNGLEARSPADYTLSTGSGHDRCPKPLHPQPQPTLTAPTSEQLATAGVVGQGRPRSTLGSDPPTGSDPRVERPLILISPFGSRTLAPREPVAVCTSVAQPMGQQGHPQRQTPPHHSRTARRHRQPRPDPHGRSVRFNAWV